MVSYGILKAADAQCFSVQGAIDPGSIALLLAAIFLAAVTSTVSLASKQCLEDYEPNDEKRSERIELEASKPIDAEKCSNDDEAINEKAGAEQCPNNIEEKNEEADVERVPDSVKGNSEVETKMMKIRSPPFVFTDLQFLLRPTTIEKSGTDDV